MKKSTKLALVLLVGVLVFTAVLLPGARNTRLDYDFEKFFPLEDPETQFFNEHRERFATDNDFVLVALCNREGIYQADFLKKVQEVTDSIRLLPNIDTAFSILDMRRMVGSTDYPYLDLSTPDSLWFDSLAIAVSPDLMGNMVGMDHQSLCIYVKHIDRLPKEGCDQLADQLERLKVTFNFDDWHHAGRAVGQSYYMRLMLSELALFLMLSIALLVVFLVIAFRSLWGVVIPILVVIMAAAWTLGLMGWLKQPINLILTVMPTILFVVGMSDVVHIVSKYLDELRGGNQKVKALQKAVKEVGIATLLTSFTTAVGFLTLLTSSIQPIREFGIYTAIGVVLAFVLSIVLLPAFLLLLPRPKVVRKREAPFWDQVLRQSFVWTIRNRKSVLVGAVVTMGLCVWGISFLGVNNFLLEDLKDGDEMKRHFLYLEEHYSGARPFELSVTSKDTTSLLTYEHMQQIDSLEKIVVDVYGLHYLFSPVTPFKAANRAKAYGSNKKYVFPSSQKDFKKTRKRLKKLFAQEMKLFVTEDETCLRIQGRVPDLGGRQFKMLNQEFDARVKRDFPNLEVAQTGTAYLIDKNNRYLSTSMMQSLIIAFFVIAAIVGVIYRSFKMVLISLVPNIFPLLMIAGFMGFVGIDIKVTTSIIFTIAFGIAVDDTIHFISKLKLELIKGRTLVYAVKRTYLSTGRAIVLTTAILCSGFMTLVFSAFMSNYYIGLLITLSLVFAVVADLLLLPVLVFFFYSNKKNRLNNERNGF